MENLPTGSMVSKCFFISFIFILFQACSHEKDVVSPPDNNTDTVKLVQLSERLHGYISIDLPQQKDCFGYRVKFLLERMTVIR